MKHFLLLSAVLFCLTATATSQTQVGVIERFPAAIPGYFTNSGHPCVVTRVYSGINEYSNTVYRYRVYESDFTTCIVDVDGIEAINTGFFDFDNNTEGTLCFTQNLFNDDDNFEWVEPYWYSVSIKSSNGATLQTIHLENGFMIDEVCAIVKIDGRFYLLIDAINEEQALYKVLVYEIKQNTGLNKVETELPLSVFPASPRRGEPVTVELGDNTNVKEIVVVNSLGQEIKRIAVEEGQREITIPSDGFNRGLNIINARGRNQSGGCKIIVR